ncbi:MAG TPA: alpha/beta hydrolase [Vicinamibacterales bacterium]|nr:alpha/beta hydrolase [Vicinamibacterales bacterium]
MPKTLLLVAALFGACKLPAPAAQVAAEPCMVAGIAEPARCSTVRVRESPRSNRDIDLRVIVLTAQTMTALPDPVVPLAGGPGQGAANLAATFAPRYAPYRDQRDIVFVDQRGTGLSNGLRCDGPIATAALMGTLFDHARLPACREALSTRADLTAYTTTAAARDYEAVLDHLGYRQANFIGTSYGSRLALEIARQLPLRVRTLTIEAVVPHTFTWPSRGAADAEAALDTLIDDCAADAACRQAFPRFRQDVDVAFTRLRRAPAMERVRDPLTGAAARVAFSQSDLAYITRGILYGNEALSLPLWFRNAAAGDFSAFAQAYVNRARNLDAQIALGVMFGVYCAEDLPFVDWQAAEAAAAGTRLGTFLLDQYRRACEVWPRANVDASFRTAVHSSVPALVMAGRHDPVTPPRTAEEAVRTLPRSKLVIWPHGGHGTDGLTSQDCRVSIAREFFRTADPAQLSTACATRDQRLPFRLR